MLAGIPPVTEETAGDNVLVTGMYVGVIDAAVTVTVDEEGPAMEWTARAWGLGDNGCPAGKT